MSSFFCRKCDDDRLSRYRAGRIIYINAMHVFSVVVLVEFVVKHDLRRHVARFIPTFFHFSGTHTVTCEIKLFQN